MLYPIKQNEEILQLFPHFALFPILYPPDSVPGALREKAVARLYFPNILLCLLKHVSTLPVEDMYKS